MHRILLAVALTASCCAAPALLAQVSLGKRYAYEGEVITNFPVATAKFVKTPKGVSVALNGLTVDRAAVDAAVDDFEAKSGRTVDRSAFKLFFTRSTLSTCSNQHAFACTEKRGSCPGECFEAVQGGNVLILPGGAPIEEIANLIKHGLLHLVMRLENHCHPAFHLVAGDLKCRPGR